MMNNPELLDVVEFVNGMGGDDRDGRFEFRTVCGGLAG